MTTLIEDLQALLTTLAPAGGVWYAANTQEPPTYPYIVFMRVISSANVTLNGPSNLQSTRVQFDIISRAVGEAVALETALESAMNGWSVQNEAMSSQDLYEEAIRCYRVSKDYLIWATN